MAAQSLHVVGTRLVVTFESRPGGRIFERTPEGVEHDWGEILAWEPPHRLAYRWHLGTDRGRARFYTVVSRDTNDTDYAQRRQRFLAEQGYAYQLVDAVEFLARA